MFRWNKHKSLPMRLLGFRGFRSLGRPLLKNLDALYKQREPNLFFELISSNFFWRLTNFTLRGLSPFLLGTRWHTRMSLFWISTPNLLASSSTAWKGSSSGDSLRPMIRLLSLLPYCSLASLWSSEKSLEASLGAGFVFNFATSSAAQNPHRNGCSMKPLGTRFGSHMGTQAGQGLPSGLGPVHLNRCVKPASSPVSSDTDPLGFEGMIHNSDKGMFSTGPPRLPCNSVNLKLFNKFITIIGR